MPEKRLIKNQGEIVVLLHDIRSIHNVGSMFRTADAAGVKKIYLSGVTPGPLDRLGKPLKPFTKVSLGAEAYIAWEEARSPRAVSKLLERLTKEGYVIFAVEQAKRSVPYHAAKRFLGAEKKAALIMGNEVRGISPGILKRADHILEIPMSGKKESLNVSVAFGIATFGLRY